MILIDSDINGDNDNTKETKIVENIKSEKDQRIWLFLEEIKFINKRVDNIVHEKKITTSCALICENNIAIIDYDNGKFVKEKNSMVDGMYQTLKHTNKNIGQKYIPFAIINVIKLYCSLDFTLHGLLICYHIIFHASIFLDELESLILHEKGTLLLNKDGTIQAACDA